jgi:glycosyltransferase involved in cell wall biosynthesis
VTAPTAPILAVGEGFEPGLVSVVIPVFNGERWLAEAVDSVVAQTYPNVEIVAVDDGSTDGSAAILARYPTVRTITQPNAGCAVARNRGITEARGEFVAFIDQDDRWTPAKLATQVALLRGRPDAGYALGHQTIFLEPGCPVPSWFGARLRLFDAPHPGLLPGTMVVRRTTFQRIGIFDAGYRIASDAEWLVRARDAGVPVVVADDVVIEKRIHDANLSSEPSNNGELLLMLAKATRRRRIERDVPVSPSPEST